MVRGFPDGRHDVPTHRPAIVTGRHCHRVMKGDRRTKPSNSVFADGYRNSPPTDRPIDLLTDCQISAPIRHFNRRTTGRADREYLPNRTSTCGKTHRPTTKPSKRHVYLWLAHGATDNIGKTALLPTVKRNLSTLRKS